MLGIFCNWDMRMLLRIVCLIEVKMVLFNCCMKKLIVIFVGIFCLESIVWIVRLLVCMLKFMLKLVRNW